MSGAKGKQTKEARRRKVTLSARIARSRALESHEQAAAQLSAASRSLNFEEPKVDGAAADTDDGALVAVVGKLDRLGEGMRALFGAVQANQEALKAFADAGGKTDQKGGIFPQRTIFDDDEANGRGGAFGDGLGSDGNITSTLGEGNLLDNCEYLERFRILSESVLLLIKDGSYLERSDVDLYLRVGHALYKEAVAGAAAKQAQVERNDPLATYGARLLQAAGVPQVKVFAFGRALVGAATFYDLLALCATKPKVQRTMAEALANAVGAGLDGSTVHELDLVTLVRVTRALEAFGAMGGPGTAAVVGAAMDGVRQAMGRVHADSGDMVDRVNDFLRFVWDHRNTNVHAWLAGHVGPHLVDPCKAARFAGVTGLDEQRYGSMLHRAAAKRLASLMAIHEAVSGAQAVMSAQMAQMQKKIEVLESQLPKGAATGAGGGGKGGGGSAGGGGKKWTRKSAKAYIAQQKHNLTSSLGPHGAKPYTIPQDVRDAGCTSSKVCLCFAAKQRGVCNVSAACQEAYCESVKTYKGEVENDDGSKRSVKWEACKAGYHRTLKPGAN